jgi:hypothetical protein
MASAADTQRARDLERAQVMGTKRYCEPCGKHRRFVTARFVVATPDDSFLCGKCSKGIKGAISIKAFWREHAAGLRVAKALEARARAREVWDPLAPGNIGARRVNRWSQGQPSPRRSAMYRGAHYHSVIIDDPIKDAGFEETARKIGDALRATLDRMGAK